MSTKKDIYDVTGHAVPFDVSCTIQNLLIAIGGIELTLAPPGSPAGLAEVDVPFFQCSGIGRKDDLLAAIRRTDQHDGDFLPVFRRKARQSRRTKSARVR